MEKAVYIIRLPLAHRTAAETLFDCDITDYDITPSFPRTMPVVKPSTAENREEKSWMCQGCIWINLGGMYCASCGQPRSAGD
jgi:hypothetical protein